MLSSAYNTFKIFFSVFNKNRDIQTDERPRLLTPAPASLLTFPYLCLPMSLSPSIFAIQRNVIGIGDALAIAMELMHSKI